MGLTIKQENFCNYYIECGNASEAYRRAYNAANMKDETIWSRASKLLAEYKVSTRVEELRKQANDMSRITKERILKELSNMAFSSISEMHNTWIERKEFDKLTDSQKASIKSISTKVLKKNVGTKEDPQIVDVEFVKIELYDKIKAIECINKMLGYNEPEKVDVGIREPMTNAKAKEIIEKLGL
jgi:phage terminase small subunit